MIDDLKIFNESIIQTGLFVKGKRPKIAIIGNAGVTDQDDEEIDKADFVVRFNNYATREAIRHSRNPVRCDILFTHFDLHSQGVKPKNVVIGIPYPFKADRVFKKQFEWYKNSHLWMVNPYKNLMLCQELELKSEGWEHPLPSLGFTALYHMRYFNADIYIGGFKWYADTLKKEIQGVPIHKPDERTNLNHFYRKEAKWICQNLKNKLNIKFSDSCNRILKMAEQAV
jgi:hypothetical protein